MACPDQVSTVRIETFCNEKIGLTKVYQDQIHSDFFGLSAFGARGLWNRNRFLYSIRGPHVDGYRRFYLQCNMISSAPRVDIASGRMIVLNASNDPVR
jgi:hypothetical protein